MQQRRTVYLGRLITGGIDPSTGRTLPDKLDNIRGALGRFQTLGVSLQQAAGVAIRVARKKVLIRSSFWSEQTHLYTINDSGDWQLYSITTEQAVIEDGQQSPNEIMLLLTELNMNATASINIVNGFKQAMGD